MVTSLKKLMDSLGYHFKNEALLQAALSHRSIGKQNYERLEFLGDAILNFVIAAEIFQRYPKAKEGELSRLRASLVNRETVAILAREFALGDYLRLGIGELKSGGVHRESILADSMEAIIGAVYLDADFVVCQQLILGWFKKRFAALTSKIIPKDFKTQLQEFLQTKHLSLPHYNLVSIHGKSHAQIFEIICNIADLKEKSIATGNSRRKAEQEAARLLLEKIRK